MINFQPTIFLFVAVAKVSFKTLSSKNPNKKIHSASINFGMMQEIRARILRVCKGQDIISYIQSM